MEENKAKNTGNEKPAEHVVIHKWCSVYFLRVQQLLSDGQRGARA